MKGRSFVILGCLCVVLGVIGIVVPGLPTTPLLLAASWLFYRSSPRLQQWLLNSRLGGRIRDYEERGGMYPQTKAMVVLLMGTMVSCSIIFFIPQRAIDILVGVLGLIGCYVVLFRVPNAKK